MTVDIERRFATLDTVITGNKLGGYAAVYNEVTEIGDYYLERLASTAFRTVLASSDLDVRGLINHNPDKLLARTPNTLRLSSDSKGLEFELDIPATTDGNDVRAMVEAGLITGCSFAFIAGELDVGEVWTPEPDGRQLRTHVSVKALLDVSVVTYPAYQGTTVSLRSKPAQAQRDSRTQMILARIATHRKESN